MSKSASIPVAATDPLAELRDIHLPEAISWWPLAPGWWITTAILLALLLTGFFIWKRHRRANAYRRQAICELSELHRDWLNNGDSHEFLLNTQLLMRRTAVYAYPNHNIAALNGEHWSNWLSSALLTSSANSKLEYDFTALGTELYRSPEFATKSETDISRLFSQCQIWLRKHSRKLDGPND